MPEEASTAYHANLSSADDLLQHARRLASKHQARGARARTFPVRRELRRHVRALNAAAAEFGALLQNGGSVPPAAEWLVDNEYMVIEQAEFVLRSFPASYYRRIPVLTTAPWRGLPRVQAIAFELLNQTGGQCDTGLVVGYLAAYQERQPLTMGELWSVPLFLRVAIISQLARTFAEINLYAAQRRQVDEWLKLFATSSGAGGDEGVREALAAAEKQLSLDNPDVLAYLARRLHELVGTPPAMMRWLEARAASQALLLSSLVDAEHGKQAQYQVIVGHLFTSLRKVSRLLWEGHFEKLSHVEQVLRRDPVAVYAEMDFDSRDLLRHTVEGLARRWHKSEVDVAKESLALAQAAYHPASAHGTKARKACHVGYYLIGPGRAGLAKSLRAPPLALFHPFELLIIHPDAVYFSAIAVLVGFFLYTLLHALAAPRVLSSGQLAAFAVLLLVPAMEWASRIWHRALMRVLPPQQLLKLEFRNGIPLEAATMVVIPTLLTTVDAAEELGHRLEIFRLANPGENIHFALLTDFPDAPQAELPGDAVVLRSALKRITELNETYPSARGSTFYLLHRARKWNPSEGVWMGWERKRGKLTEFNALLRGSVETSSYAQIVGDRSIFLSIRYVITLDADTQLPRDAAVKLIGAMAHPLNAPVLSPEKTRVISGYGLLQPRIAISHASTQASWFAAIFGGKAGVDTYSAVVSDPYQELFQFGIFTGKGIYDVRVFDQILRNRIPDNAVLSHDLLEGGFLRAGLVTDVELIDDYPPSFISSLARLHRWVRGDIQLLPWLFPRVRDRRGKSIPVSLPAITRWQMIDNWRRSLLGPAYFGLILLGLWWLPARGLRLDPLLLMVVGVPAVIAVVDFLQGIKQGLDPLRSLAPPIFGVIFLPYHALTMLSAVSSALFRLLVSHRHMLKWVTSANEGLQAPGTLAGTWQRMLYGQVLVAGTMLAATLTRPHTWSIAAALALLWLPAPYWAFLLNKPVQRHDHPLAPEDLRYLREVARRTWHFFATVVGPGDHWLPPDNLQVDPANGLAHRTSPTNVGFLLASTAVARDFGYITTTEMLDRLEGTVETLESLPRWHGHFYNWYDTVSLAPLAPLYVSTVDSGNIAAYLLAVKASIREWLERPLVDSQSRQGLIDTLRWENGSGSGSAVLDVLEALRDPGASGESLLSWYKSLTLLAADPGLPPHTAQAVQAARRELEVLLPWLAFLAARDRLGSTGGVPDPADAELARRVESLRTLPEIVRCAQALEEPVLGDVEAPRDATGPPIGELSRLVAASGVAVLAHLARGERLMARLGDLVNQHEFLHLFDPQRRLFAIGYNVTSGRLDPSYYDLMASEARQTSFLAIALGQVPTRHWFALSRTLTLINRVPTLVSWSGTMFEYLMPLLLLPSYPETLWDLTYRMVIKRQIHYAGRLGLPWGISESGFNAHDFNLNYQYQAFGVPGLGLKPGLAADLVVSPYSTLLAAGIAPWRAVENLRNLERHGSLGDYGFFEALDFTPNRVPLGSGWAVVKSYMAHHQGMALLSLGNVLLGGRMQRRFLSDPRTAAAEALLRERTPARALIIPPGQSRAVAKGSLREDAAVLRYFHTADTLLPEARVLSNGRYVVMVTNSGGGFSQWGNVAVTRWREDPTRDAYGTFFYIRDLTRNRLWSPTHQPCRVAPEDATMRYFLEKVAYERTDGEIQTRTEICVSPEVDAEIRQITLVNRGADSHVLEVTSYVEPVLSPAADDRAHTAFNRLFIETEAVPDGQELLAHRRPRRPDDPAPWLVHSVTVDGETLGPLEYETDRSRFVGRGRSASLPQAVQTNQRLAGTTGPVLDPILCLRRRIELAPGKTARFWFVTGVAEKREGALAISRQLRQPFQLDHAFELAWTRSRIVLRYLNLQPRHDNLFQWMASQLFYFNPYRPRRNLACLKNAKGPSGLWAYGISGDLPIVLVRLSSPEGLDLVGTVLRAHEYWRLKGLHADLVILNDFQGSYEQPLQEELRGLLEASSDHDNLDRPGGVFLRSGRLMSEEDQTLLETVARISLRGEAGDLVDQLQSQPEGVAIPPLLPGGKMSPTLPPAAVAPALPAALVTPPADLLFFNGWGGFAPSGREYVIHLRGNDLPPAPWLNIIANPGFGFQVSEAGGGYTWSENSREHKLTPWSNDSVLDPAGEICYLRDEEDGYFWSVTPLPVREGEPYNVRHGQGYTLFNHDSHGLAQSGLVFVPPNDPVKIFRLDLSNAEARPRRLSVTYYLEWVLGVSRDEAAPYIVTTRDQETGALFARHVYQESFPGRQAFLHVWSDDPEARTSVTSDRAEFIGRNGSLARPAALARTDLSGRAGAMSDSCGAVQLKLTIGPRATRTVVVIIGSAKSVEEARKYIQTYGLMSKVGEAYDQARNAWDALLDRVQVKTPDPGLDLLLNRWLLYQVLSCRLWARSALYQSGGAYGFRDQLQDALALLHARPDLVRDQILKHAAHQFSEGDVQHWWHEETGRGIRTRSSDDLLWLPYVVCRYEEHTADSSIWDESVPYLSDEPLGETEDERYGVTRVSEEAGSVYEHCVRAVDRALRFGDHGLPLMGAGDWNDGMNAVGRKGRGESVWLGWFLFSILRAMAPVARGRRDDRAGLYQEAADRLARALDESGWDGQWYRRAYDDEGEPLGSQHSVECQIDCIAQAWAALSKAAPPDKAHTAMESLENRLVDRDNGLIYLLTPPFDETTPSPGYIEGYPPGVRENGGQYTHGAVWAAMAWAELGEGDRAYELLRMLNPVYHARTHSEALHYRVEPYVMAADIYSAASQLGRGGWTWYTGAAGWMYQAGLEWVLGVRRRGDRLLLQPCIPAEWREYTVNYRYGESHYVIQVNNPARRQTGATSFELDGAAMDPHQPAIPLVDDGRTHRAVLVL